MGEKTSMNCHNPRNVSCDEEDEEQDSLGRERPYPAERGATLAKRTMKHLKLFYMNQLKRCEPQNATSSQ
jgi:hypothetical protein